MLDPGSHGSDSGLRAVRQDNEAVVPEDLRDGVLVVGEVLFEGQLQLSVGRLQFNKDQRNPVDEAHEVSPLLAVVAADPKLGKVDARNYINDRYLKRLEEEGFVQKLFAR